ncbi:MAG: rRNA maturation RNase YbeY [Candidatus Eremiobacteraeota bacterium]|nr:rRNA maturation RNase YbeY [Candidatus Eremiobacteraeota bacterium]
MVISHQVEESSEVRESLLRQAATVAARVGGCREEAELSLVIADDPTIRQLNRDYRGIDKATDVLSFAQDEGPAFPQSGIRLLGDVIVSLETVRNQAARNAVSFERELAWVVCHGVLHLLGYDHQDDEEHAEMVSLESQALRELGFQ